MRIVEKYGGSSLADEEKLLRAARRTVEQARQGHEMVMVVSARGDTTDIILKMARDVFSEAAGRELDACLAVGEPLSAGLMALAIEKIGHPAVSLTGEQAGIHTDGVYGNAKIIHVDTSRLETELRKGRIAVVAGFQGIGPRGDVTTLGRNGSDTTAVALAAWLKADKCRIYTDVDGVYHRDPRKYPDAVRYNRISYEQMLTMTRQGAQVLHDRSVELARRFSIPVEVLSAVTGEPGTLVTEAV